jgi:hypothetical protein
LGELINNRVKSCGSNECRKQAGAFHKLPFGTSAKNKIIGRYRRLAAKRNLEFDLTSEQLNKLFVGNCHYCGIEPSMINRNDGGEFTFNGIDRKTPELGYTKSNCVSCCKPCNWAKGLTSYKDFTTYLDRIASYRK